MILSIRELHSDPICTDLTRSLDGLDDSFYGALLIRDNVPVLLCLVFLGFLGVSLAGDALGLLECLLLM